MNLLFSSEFHIDANGFGTTSTAGAGRLRVDTLDGVGHAVSKAISALDALIHSGNMSYFFSNFNSDFYFALLFSLVFMELAIIFSL